MEAVVLINVETYNPDNGGILISLATLLQTLKRTSTPKKF